jgi:hypothetical protein
LGQEKSILGHNKIKYGKEQIDYLGHEKLTYGHNETNFGPEQGDFLGQENLILSHMRQIWGLNECWKKRYQLAPPLGAVP